MSTAEERRRAVAIRRRQARRRMIRRRRQTALIGLVALALGLVWLLSPSSPRRVPSVPRARVVTRVSHHASKPPPAVPSPGSLPQTTARPPGNSALLRSEMAGLWRGIVRDELAPALPAFFPRGAYVQLKTIVGAGTDWSNRLVGEYRLDIGAAHAQLGAGARSAKLVSVSVPESYAHWVTAGVCANGIGYYEVPNTRIVYREDGQIRSLGIASMISWRGAWYVVHFGAILRAGAGGEVDAPAVGVGVSAYSGTC